MRDDKALFRISELLAKKATGLLTNDESRELETWRKENPLNEATYKQLSDEAYLHAAYVNYSRVDGSSALSQMRQRVKTSRGHIRRLYTGAATTAAVVMLGIGGLFLVEHDHHHPLTPGGEITRIVTNRPVLRLEGGRTLSVDSISSGLEESGSIIKQAEKGMLVYSQKDTQPTLLTYNTLEVPRGAEFNLTLEDGTRVWLNADSKLKYPVIFIGQERKVMLEGEAYFQVTKDKKRPFRVVVEGQTVEVLGTEFNVSAYPRETYYTTLVNGQVKVTEARGQEVILKPGMQCVQGNDLFFTRHVNIEEIVSWRENMFVLEEQTIEEILSKLERWYNFSVFYQDESVKKVTFKGRIPRYVSFESVLDILQKTREVKFIIQGSVVTVYK